MWPTSGPAELFGNAEGYHTVVQDMVDRGAALDAGLVNLDVRLSSRYPTVEFRVADVCTDLDDAVLIAALARALVSHCADQWRSGAPSAAWRVDELRAAAWRAARFGLTSSLVSPVTRQLIDAVDVLQQLVALLADPLEQTGDLARVTAGVAALGVRGNGASRQRAVFDTHGDIAAVLADIRTRTTTHACAPRWGAGSLWTRVSKIRSMYASPSASSGRGASPGIVVRHMTAAPSPSICVLSFVGPALEQFARQRRSVLDQDDRKVVVEATPRDMGGHRGHDRSERVLHRP